MNQGQNLTTAKCHFGDQRLTHRAVLIEEKLSVKYGKPLSSVFEGAGELKRAYEFFAHQKTSFNRVIEPYHQKTALSLSELPIALAVGDTTYLDYKKILQKREEYGPIGNGGNGLILHSTLALDANNGQPIGLLTEKLWHREHEESKSKTYEAEAEKTSRSQKTPY